MGATRQELESLWRDRVRDAKIRLDLARSYLEEVRQDRGSGAIPAADGDDAYRRALQADREALTELARVLRIFTELLVHGEIPDEADTARQRTERTPCGRGSEALAEARPQGARRKQRHAVSHSRCDSS